MKMVIFGLTISSSWGNGHATLWRGLTRALAERGWRIVFFERDAPYYARTRDLFEIEGGDLILYDSLLEVRARAERELHEADVAVVTSYCPDALAAGDIAENSSVGIRVFYDLDSPVTLAQIEGGERPDYIGERGLASYDVVLSYAGGSALDGLRERLGARRVFPLYGHVDPRLHRPARPREDFAGDLSYLGTYSADRQDGVTRLLIGVARRRPDRRFVIGGALYPQEFPWTPNVFFVKHIPPEDHSAFFCSSRSTLSVTRRAMAEIGWCPSGRLFEAAACGAPIISDVWPGIEDFFEPGREILLARGTEDVLDALERTPAELLPMAARARERVLAEHTSKHRAVEFERILCDALQQTA